MRSGDRQTGAVSIQFGDRPRDDELDLFGLTHRGLVRKNNQDQFLLATVHPQVLIREPDGRWSSAARRCPAGRSLP